MAVPALAIHTQDASSAPLSLGVPSSSSSSFTGTAYTPLSQRLRSTSAQRRLQNGRNVSTAGLPQIGQGLLQISRSDMTCHMVMAARGARRHTTLSQPARIG